MPASSDFLRMNPRGLLQWSLMAAHHATVYPIVRDDGFGVGLWGFHM